LDGLGDQREVGVDRLVQVDEDLGLPRGLEAEHLDGDGVRAAHAEASDVIAAALTDGRPVLGPAGLVNREHAGADDRRPGAADNGAGYGTGRDALGSQGRGGNNENKGDR
jgi:hypothetical protein